MPCSVAVGYHRFRGPLCLQPEDRGSIVLRNFGILEHHYRRSHLGGSRLEYFEM